VQESAITSSEDVRNHCRGQATGEPTTPEVRMSTDTAQFGVAGNPHSFSRHGDEPAVNANSNEAAHAIRSLEERTRLGEFRQCHHVGGIGIRQVSDVRSRNVTRASGREHLDAERRLHFNELGGSHNLRNL